MYFDNRKVLGVLLQFNDLDRIICGVNTPQMTEEDADKAAMRENRRDGELVCGENRVLLASLLPQLLDEFDFELVDAGWQRRIRTAGGNFFSSRYLFVPEESAQQVRSQVAQAYLDAENLCEKYLWRVAVYANPIEIDNVIEGDSVFITINGYDRYRFLEKDGSIRRVNGEEVEPEGKIFFDYNSLEVI